MPSKELFGSLDVQQHCYTAPDDWDPNPGLAGNFLGSGLTSWRRSGHLLS